MKYKLIAMLLATSMLSGCLGESVEVPPASVGMVLGKNGYQGALITPSRFRLDKCFFNCDKLVVIEAGDAGRIENMEVLMPKDNLILGIGVQFTLALSTNQDIIMSVFDRVTPVQLPSGNFGTSLGDIYGVYGEAVVRNVVRSTLSKYTIAEIANNQEAVSEKLRQNVSAALVKTPLEVKQFGLANIDYPEMIKNAMEATQERKLAIEKADADAQVQIREAQTALEVTRAQREGDLLAARTIAESNKILAEGVTPELIRYLELETLKVMAKNQNAVFFPVEMLGSAALENKVLKVGE